MKILFKSCVKAKLSVNGQSFGTVWDNPVPFTADSAFDAVLLPVSDKNTYFQRLYHFELTGTLSCENSEVIITDCKDGNFIAEFCPLPYFPSAYPTVIEQKTYGIPSLTHTATLMKDSAFMVIIECKDFMHTVRLPFDIEKVSLVVKQLHGMDILQISCESEKQNYYVVCDFSEDYYNLYEKRAEELTISDNKLTETLYYADNLGHTVITEYAKEKNKLKALQHRRYCSKDKKAEELHESLLPYLFFEGVRAGYLEECKGYLAEDLKFSESDLKAFFGDFCNVFQNPFTFEIALLYRLSETRYFIRNFTAEQQNRKIVNIYENE